MPRGRPKQDKLKCERCHEYRSRDLFNSSDICNVCKSKPHGNIGRQRTPKPMRICKKCNVNQPITNFERESASNQYVYVCNACVRKKLSEDEIKAKKLAWHKSERGYEVKREAMKRYRQTEQGNIHSKVYSHKRRATIKNAGTYTLEEWRAILEKYNYTCLRCKCTDCKLTVDHVKPLSKGGCNTADNLQPLCRVCNSTKNTKHIDYR